MMATERELVEAFYIRFWRWNDEGVETPPPEESPPREEPPPIPTDLPPDRGHYRDVSYSSSGGSSSAVSSHRASASSSRSGKEHENPAMRQIKGLLKKMDRTWTKKFNTVIGSMAQLKSQAEQTKDIPIEELIPEEVEADFYHGGWPI